MRFSEDRMDKLCCSDQVKRDIHIWEPSHPKAVFLAIHGGLAHGGDYVTPALYLKQQGFATVSYDMVGHDRKQCVHITRFEQFLDDAELFLQWVKSQYPGLPVFVMGHSMGGVIATHLGVKRFTADEAVKGYVLSSPFYVNNVETPAWLMAMSRVFAKILPKLKVPVENFTHSLTHDKKITQRHIDDERDHIRASSLTCRFAVELTNALQGLEAMLPTWRQPLFAVIAGNDRLASSEGTLKLLKSVDQQLLECHVYPDNFHENFNELNRDDIFQKINVWVNNLIEPQG